MRVLLHFTMGFAAACGCCVYGLPEKWRLPVIAAAGICVLICFVLSGKSKWMGGAAVIFLGVAVGIAWFIRYDGRYLSAAREMDGTEAVYSVRASDFARETDYGMAFEGTMVIKGQTYKVKTYLNEPVPVVPGDLVTGQLRLRVTLPDASAESLYDQGKGIFLVAYQRGEISVSAYDVRWYDRIAQLRLWIKSTLLEIFPEDTAPFSIALLLGDGSGLDYSTDTDFKLSGIRHVIAVSGLHVSILFALVSTVTLRKRYLTSLLGYPLLFLFAALAGFTPSVTRACIMCALMLLAMLVEKEYDGPTALAFSSVIMLVWNPCVIADVGFQLSVGSVSGIYLFDPAVRKWLLSLFGDLKGKRIKSNLVKGLCSSVSATISATAVTTPLCAICFGTISLAGVITNLLTLWIITVIFYGILLVCLLARIAYPAAVFAGKMIAWPIRYVLRIARLIGSFPLAAVYTRSIYVVFWLIFAYLLLGVFLVMKKKRPRTLLCCGILGLSLALTSSWLEPLLTDFHFFVLDVGQGQCLLVQYKGSTFLVDCGGDSDEKTADIAAETLLSQGFGSLDCMILTHLDRDHAGAAENFLKRIPTELLILPAAAPELAEAVKGQVVYACEDICIEGEGIRVEIYAANFPGNSNEMSLCILFDTEKCDILITGDRNGFGERSLLRYHAIPEVDILVAGHHGSKNSTCEELLDAVKPEIVCISAGEENRYGHPAPELLQRLRQYGCAVYRTDEDGTIVIRR